MSGTDHPTQSNFQSESTASGKEFEDLVNKDLLSRGYTILDNNVKIPDIGINVDYIAEKNGVVEYGEDKGGKAGNKKRPGAQRTDNVKKAICNGALLKTKYPNANYVIYFSAKPQKGKSSDLMINTAISAGYVDEIRYLEYEMNQQKRIEQLNFSYFVSENHEGKPALYMCGIDCVEPEDGFTKNDLDTFMEFLKEQHSRLEASENNQHQYPLFKEGFEMPTAKDENDG